MILTLRDRIARGGFADIFSPPPGDRVFKLFRRLRSTMLGQVAPFVFQAEIAAYELARADTILAAHVPVFFGPTAIDSVTTKRGRDRSSAYWLTLCYSTTRLAADPKERKVGSFYNDAEWHLMEPFEQRFEAIGINHVGDASVLFFDTGHPLFIDFATTDAAANHAVVSI